MMLGVAPHIIRHEEAVGEKQAAREVHVHIFGECHPLVAMCHKNISKTLGEIRYHSYDEFVQQAKMKHSCKVIANQGLQIAMNQ